MRTDFSPLLRSSIGFDRVFDLLENVSRVQPLDSWPAYDIARTGDDQYRITMAVPGFSREELTVTHQPNMLVVSGQKSQDEQTQYLHRGLTGRAFERRFELADYVKIAGANLENGLLTIDLVREVPEEMRPRRIEIGTGGLLPENEPRQIEGQRQAA